MKLLTFKSGAGRVAINPCHIVAVKPPHGPVPTMVYLVNGHHEVDDGFEDVVRRWQNALAEPLSTTDGSERVIKRCTHAGWVAGLETAAAEYEKYALETKGLLDHFHEQRDVESYGRYRGKYDDQMSVVKRLRALAAAHEEG